MPRPDVGGLDGASTTGRLGRRRCPLEHAGGLGPAGDAVGRSAPAKALQSRDSAPRHPHVGQTAVSAFTSSQHIDPVGPVWREEEFRRLPGVERQDESHSGGSRSILEAGSVGGLVGPGPWVLHDEQGPAIDDEMTGSDAPHGKHR
jgi:hypothetical protein